MTAELGIFFLILAMLVAVFQGAYLLPNANLKLVFSKNQSTCAWLQALLVTLALATLMILRLNNDFSVINVVSHSNLSLPTLYKIVGSWGNHEGSMLLWVWVLAVFGMILSLRTSHTDTLRYALAVQALLAAGVLLFILCTSNPFERVFPPLADGQELNPILQDVGLAIHPPLLYLGYVGFSIVFSLAVALLIRPCDERTWARTLHLWILASWSALTLGIGLGSWWAYRELGWGGWWFWDPVENASLLPWLAGTALLHSNSVLKKRGLLAQWVVLLAIITFGLSLIGTFLVRSGALTSVHSFANDPARGLFILGYIVAVVGGALLLFALRGGRLRTSGHMQPLSREGMIVVNNLFILTACATVLLGTIYPLLIEWFQGSKLTVGPPYFNVTFLPLMALPLWCAGIALLMPWKQASFRKIAISMQPAWLAALAMTILVLAVAKTEILWAVIGFGLAAWLIAASLKSLFVFPHMQGKWAIFLGHVGAAIMVAGITGSSLWKETKESWVAVGDTLEISDYQLTYEKETHLELPNYKSKQGTFSLKRNGTIITMLIPEYRTYTIRNMSTHETDIYSTPWQDVYAVIGETSADGKKTAARVYIISMMGFIWAGFVVMALAGVISLLGKRGNNES